MEEVILLNVVWVSSAEKYDSDVYVYGREQFLGRYENCMGKECIHGKYSVEHEYTWYFKTEEQMMDLLQKRGIAEYFVIEDCKEDLGCLIYEAVQCLNYHYWNRPLLKLRKNYSYWGENGKVYICIDSGGYRGYHSKWLDAQELKPYISSNSLREIVYAVPKEMDKHIINFWDLPTDIVSIYQKVILSEI